MDTDELKKAVDNGFIEWQRHAFEQMMQRGISRKAVIEVLKSGEIIEDCPDDKPYPSSLLLGWIMGEPLHVVIAFDAVYKLCFVITAYKPDLEYFESDYRTRRRL